MRKDKKNGLYVVMDFVDGGLVVDLPGVEFESRGAT